MRSTIQPCRLGIGWGIRRAEGSSAGILSPLGRRVFANGLTWPQDEGSGKNPLSHGPCGSTGAGTDEVVRFIRQPAGSQDLGLISLAFHGWTGLVVIGKHSAHGLMLMPPRYRLQPAEKLRLSSLFQLREVGKTPPGEFVIVS